MRSVGIALKLCGLACAGFLSACVAIPVGPAPLPLVAYPGATKTPAQFAQDDVACRATAGGIATQAVRQPAPGAATTDAPVQPTPESVYFSCMTSHGNVIAAAPGAGSPYYARYAVAYGAYPYPAFYPGVFADGYFLDREVGLYGGFREGWGGWRGREWGGREWGGREWGGRGGGFRR